MTDLAPTAAPSPSNHQVFLVTGFYDNNPEDVGLLKVIGSSPIALTDLIQRILPDFSVAMMLSLHDMQAVVDQLEQRALQLQVEESRLYNVAGHTAGDLVPYRTVPVVASSPTDAMAGAVSSIPSFAPLGALNLVSLRSLLEELMRCRVTGQADVKEEGF